tara:strand:- start:292 stop:1467 length:1176 start_codon:yes stop_codon:yes gene_type:complete
MDVYEKFLRSICYKFPKGYPDMSNEEDVLLLESLLEGILGEGYDKIPNKALTIKAVKKIVDTIGSKYGLSTLKSNKNRLSAPGVKDPNEFIKFFKEVFGEDIQIKTYGPNEGPNPSGTFSLFQFKTMVGDEFGEVNIVGSYSPPGGRGKESENVFIRNINELIVQSGGEANVKIISPKYTETFNNVTQAQDSSTANTGKGDKSDVKLLSENNEVVANISLKQDKGFKWASVASDYRNFIKTFEKKAHNGSIEGFGLEKNPDVEGKYLMYNPNTGERITKVIIPDIIEDEDRMNSFIFGDKSLLPKVIVVEKTWKDGDFKYDSNTNTITAQSSHIYKSLDDVKKGGVEPVFVIAQHQDKPIGLDYRIFPANAAKIGPRSRGIELSFNDIITK